MATNTVSAQAASKRHASDMPRGPDGAGRTALVRVTSSHRLGFGRGGWRAFFQSRLNGSLDEAGMQNRSSRGNPQFFDCLM
ncbi:MAG: hypothetical protein EKK53_00515 [Burkholderiales bacterium]|nr:MAG: hypothetical protein EKK53_00515 [Burkholderiales bacterium]